MKGFRIKTASFKILVNLSLIYHPIADVMQSEIQFVKSTTRYTLILTRPKHFLIQRNVHNKSVVALPDLRTFYLSKFRITEF
jgi:hypothetical protein